MKKLLTKISLSNLILSIIFSIALFYMSKINFLGYVFNENYIDNIFLNEFSILFFLIPIAYILLHFIEKNYIKLSSIIISNQEIENKTFFCCRVFIFLLIIYLIYYFTFYPGGVYIDSWTAFNMLTGENEFTSQQPVLYTLMLYIVKLFLPDLYTGFGIFTLLQVIAMISVFTYFIYWLLTKKVNSIFVTLIALFLGFFNLYPLYSVSIWKDTPFSLAIFLYTLTLIDLIIDSKNQNIQIRNIVKFNLFALLVLFLRNNGIYICLGTIFILLFLFFIDIIKKTKIKHIVSFTITSISTILFFLIIESLYPYFGIDTSSTLVESIGIPLQQVARVVAVDGNLTNNQKELIEKILPIENIKKNYRAMLVDPIKWDSNFNNEYLENHLQDYFKLWFEIFLQNPNEYIKSYLLQTSGFWALHVKGPEAFHSAVIWETLNNILQNQDLIAQRSHFSFRDDLLKIPYYSGGFFFWITILSMFITFKNCNKKYLIGYIPSLLLWLTVMISTPMASALRYVYALVLILPLNIVYPAIFKNKNNEIKLLDSKSK